MPNAPARDVDDDTPPPRALTPQLTWEAEGHPGLPAHGVWEGDCGAGLVTVTFRLSSPVGYDVRFDWSTEGDTATAGVDFESGSGHVTIPSGQTTATITVKVLSDMTPEGGSRTHEDFFVRVRNLSPNVTAANASGFIAIIDDDPAGMRPDCSHPETSINDKNRPGAISTWEAASTLPQAPASQGAGTIASVVAAGGATGAKGAARVLKFKRFNRAGKPMFRIDCKSSAVSCVGKVVVRVGTRAAGTASFGVDAGQAGYVSVAINRRIKRLIGRGGRLAMTGIIIVSGKPTATSAFTARYADLNPQPLPPKGKSKRHRNGDDRSLNPQPLPPKEKRINSRH
jgi:Calx-beta domain